MAARNKPPTAKRRAELKALARKRHSITSKVSDKAAADSAKAMEYGIDAASLLAPGAAAVKYAGKKLAKSAIKKAATKKKAAAKKKFDAMAQARKRADVESGGRRLDSAKADRMFGKTSPHRPKPTKATPKNRRRDLRAPPQQQAVKVRPAMRAVKKQPKKPKTPSAKKLGKDIKKLRKSMKGSDLEKKLGKDMDLAEQFLKRVAKPKRRTFKESLKEAKRLEFEGKVSKRADRLHQVERKQAWKEGRKPKDKAEAQRYARRAEEMKDRQIAKKRPAENKARRKRMVKSGAAVGVMGYVAGRETKRKLGMNKKPPAASGAATSIKRKKRTVKKKPVTGARARKTRARRAR